VSSDDDESFLVKCGWALIGVGVFVIMVLAVFIAFEAANL